MYKLGGRRKLGKTASHRRAMIDNQLKSLLNESKVKTTTPKAKVLKANVDSYIARITKKDQNSIEVSLSEYVTDAEVKKVLLKYLTTSPIVKIVKVGYRIGDNAELSRVFLDGYTPKKKSSVKSMRKEEKKIDETKEVEESSVASRSEQTTERAKSLTRSLRDKVIGGKERARTRSGI